MPKLGEGRPAVEICAGENGQWAHRGEWSLSARINRHGRCWLKFSLSREHDVANIIA